MIRKGPDAIPYSWLLLNTATAMWFLPLLIAALLVFALCAALVVAMELEFSRLYQRVGNILLAEQAYIFARLPIYRL